MFLNCLVTKCTIWECSIWEFTTADEPFLSSVFFLVFFGVKRVRKLKVSCVAIGFEYAHFVIISNKVKTKGCFYNALISVVLCYNQQRYNNVFWDICSYGRTSPMTILKLILTDS